MGGFFGVVSKKSCTNDLFFGVDYHSHLGTRRGGMAVYGENGFVRSIHNIENSPFRSKFDKELDELEGKMQSAAIKAFDQHSGNCFGQAAMMHYLLQAAGIPDMTVAARDEEGLIGHWWNLVKLGDYYYHMDATPYRGDPEPVLLTTEEFLEFWDDLEGVRPMHEYDEWNYPKSGDTQRRKSEQKEEAEQQEETEQEEDI